MEEKARNTDKSDQPKGIFSRKSKMNNYWAIHETMQAGLKPPWALFNAFMREADLITSYKRNNKEGISSAIRLLCRKFEEAYKNNDIMRMITLYEDLEALKSGESQVT